MGANGPVDEGSNANYTISINTFQRPDNLEKVIRHWLTCKPKQIRVTWMEGDAAIPDFLRAAEENGTVVLDREDDKLTNRFKPHTFVTDAIFPVDDDVYYGCTAMTTAFHVWSQNPLQPVGFAPRYLSCTRTHLFSKSRRCTYVANSAWH